MKTRIYALFLAVISFLGLEAPPAFGQVTAFTYQGRLSDTNGQPLNGSYDFQFRLYDASSGGNQIPIIPLSPGVTVSNGLFTTAMDFGTNVFNGTVYWLEIAVQPHNGASFTTLSPRQEILPVPGAIFATSASNLLGALPAAQLTGTVGNSSLPASPNFSGAVSANSFFGSGGGLTNVNALLLGGLASSNFWQLGGNVGSPLGILGTVDSTPLSIIAGGQQLLRLEAVQRSGGFFSPTFYAGNVTGGAYYNSIWSGVLGGTIAGGGSYELFPLVGQSLFPNVVSDDYGTIGGGLNNLTGNTNSDVTDASYATVGGGYQNVASATASTVGGGYQNLASGGGSTIAGGVNNTNSGNWAAVGGGVLNTASGETAVVAGGNGNLASGLRAFVGGGEANLGLGLNSVIGGGFANTNNGGAATVGGGSYNAASGDNSTVGGGDENIAGGTYASVGGGEFNSATGYGAVIAGGGTDGSLFSPYSNVASGPGSAILGGVGNSTAGYESTVGGGVGNQATNSGATVPGGSYNVAGGFYSFAAGQAAQALHNGSFVWADYSQFSAFSSTSSNQFLIRALGGVGIGTPNPQGSLHVYSDNNPTVVRIQSTGTPGFGRIEFVSNPQNDVNQWRPAYIQSLDAGGFTGGLGFYLNGTGSGNKFGANEVMRLINGNVGIGTTNPTNRLQVALAYCTGLNWVNSSDRNLKENFAELDAVKILEKIVAMPITRWNYKSEPGQKHIGPMAQDFHAAFQLGDSDRSISTVDEGGVALAAIQGLNQKVEAENASLRAENTELKQRLEKLERLVESKFPEEH